MQIDGIKIAKEDLEKELSSLKIKSMEEKDSDLNLKLNLIKLYDTSVILNQKMNRAERRKNQFQKKTASFREYYRVMEGIKFQDIKKKLMHELSTNIYHWNDVISNTDPANYGIVSWNVGASEDDCIIDISSKTFSFENVRFSAEFVLGATKEEDSFLQDFNRIASGSGRFEFIDSNKVQIIDVNIEMDSDIFADDPS